MIPIADAIGWTLIHSLWQGVAAALLLFAVLRLTRAPNVRYFAGLAAMLTTLAAFVATLFIYWPRPHSMLVPLGHANFTLTTPITAGGILTPASLAFEQYVPFIGAFWIAGVVVAHLWQFAGLLSIRRLRRRGAFPAPDLWTARLHHLQLRLRVSRPVALLESVLAQSPVVLGHFRPVIFVPAALLTNLPPAHIEAILLHELAHIRRCDYLVNLLQRWVEGLLFYHPAIWWISHVVRDEREHCCDDTAIALYGNPHEYARALSSLEQIRFAPAPAAAGGSLLSRIQRILGRPRTPSASGLAPALTLLIATAALTFANWQPAQAPAPKPTPQPQPILLRKPEPKHTPYDKWLEEDVAYIVTPKERTEFLHLTTGADRQHFIEQFWLRRDPTPSAPNEFKEEHYRRIAYANQRFASGVPGWKTDRGRIYITYGPPDEIESYPSGAATEPPFEHWRYRGDHIITYTFIDKNRTGDYSLVSRDLTRPAAFNRAISWTVTNQIGRFIGNIPSLHFVIRENGRAINPAFVLPPGPTAIAIVTDSALPGLPSPGMMANLIITPSLTSAIRQLEILDIRRKFLILTGSTYDAPLPPGIVVMKFEPALIPQALVEACNQYIAGIEATDPAAPIEVSILPGRNYPDLTVHQLRQ